MKNKIILVDQVIDLDGRWTHVVMLEITPDATILHLRQEGGKPNPQGESSVPMSAEGLPYFPKPVLKDDTTELVWHASETGGSSFADQVALLYTPQAEGSVVVMDSRGTELLAVTV